MSATYTIRYVMKLICPDAETCDSENCKHVKVHERPYMCSYYCNRLSKIVKCREVKPKA